MIKKYTEIKQKQSCKVQETEKKLNLKQRPQSKAILLPFVTMVFCDPAKDLNPQTTKQHTSKRDTQTGTLKAGEG